MTRPDELFAMLKRHHLPDNRPPGGVLAGEIESPCGRRRADALWMPTTHAGDRSLVGYEIKVTRADVLAELADPTKADAWGQFCGYWWLVIPDESLIEGLVIPEHWGVMTPPSGRRTRSMTPLRPAPRQHPTETGPAFRRIAVWMANRYRDHEVSLEHSLKYARSEADQLQRQLDELHRSGIRPEHLTEQEQFTRRVVERARTEVPRWRHLDEDEIVATLVDLVEVRNAIARSRLALETAVRQAEHLTSSVARMHDQLTEIQLDALEVS